MSELEASDPLPAVPVAVRPVSPPAPRLWPRACALFAPVCKAHLQSLTEAVSNAYTSGIGCTEVIALPKRRLWFRILTVPGPSRVRMGASLSAGAGRGHARQAARASRFTQGQKQDLHLEPSRVHYGTAGAASMSWTRKSASIASRPCRICTMRRIVDSLDNVHFYSGRCFAATYPTNFEMDMNTLYACCAATTKHVGVSFTSPDYIPRHWKCCT